MGFADYFTGPVLSFALFYLLPVSLTAWVLGRRPGLVVAAAATVAWLAAELLGPLAELVHADGSWEPLGEGGQALGFFPDAAFREGEVVVAAGDRLVLFTDGVTERAGPNGAEFGEERLVATLVANRAEEAAGLRDTVVDAVERFGRGPFDDDLTLVVAALE
jgi:hypothetical protein